MVRCKKILACIMGFNFLLLLMSGTMPVTKTTSLGSDGGRGNNARRCCRRKSLLSKPTPQAGLLPGSQDRPGSPSPDSWEIWVRSSSNLKHRSITLSGITGGLLGLFTGMSILSMFEVIFWIARIFGDSLAPDPGRDAGWAEQLRPEIVKKQKFRI